MEIPECFGERFEDDWTADVSVEGKDLQMVLAPELKGIDQLFIITVKLVTQIQRTKYRARSGG